MSPTLIQDAAGPLADVLRALDAGQVAPAVAVATHILAAEVLTTQAECCPDCATSEGDLCVPCHEISAQAADHREQAGQLRQEVLA